VKHRLPFIGLVLTLTFAVAGTAYAFDCIRVSKTLTGLKQSTKSGNWLLFNFGSASGVDDTFTNVFGLELDDQQAACIAKEYAGSGQPKYFALGIGVGGVSNENENGKRGEAGGYGVLAWNNKNFRVLSDGRGIDSLEHSPIVGAAIGATITCGVEIPEEE